MWLPNGRPIRAKDIEILVSEHFTDLSEFINLCNSVAWSTRGKREAGIPSFTERYEVKDGGIDAEWMPFESPLDKPQSGPLLVPGWNIFQYKQFDVTTQSRDKCFTRLKNKVAGAVKSLYERTGRRPDGYVLFTNLHLTHKTASTDKKGKKTVPQKAQLEEALLKGYDQSDNVKVKIVAAGELAAILNDLPHLRSAYFSRDDFMTLAEYRTEHWNASLFGKASGFTGRDHLVNVFQSEVSDPQVRVIVVSGAPNVGKTRLVLEAIADRSTDVVVARDPFLVTSGSVTSLLTPHHMTIVFVPHGGSRLIEELVRFAISKANLKLLVELHDSDQFSGPWYDEDPRVRSIEVPPLTDSESGALLAATKVKFDTGLESWVLDQASGNPGLLILAVHNAREITGTNIPLGDRVSESIIKKIRAELGPERLDSIRLLSLLDPFPLDSGPQGEIAVLCRNAGMSGKLSRVLDDISVLKDRGYLRAGSSYAAVQPTLLANRLASGAASNMVSDLWGLLRDLTPRGQLCLLRRLRVVQGPDIDAFFARVFGPNGLFRDFQFSGAQLELLRTVAGKLPEQTAQMLLNKLETMDRVALTKLLQSVYLELLWLLQLLLVLEITSEIVLRCLAIIAELDETRENLHPNSKALFCGFFHPLHPQVPLSLERRLDLLKEFASPQRAITLRSLALEAMKTALKRSVWTVSQDFPGPSPTPRPEKTNLSKAFKYRDELYDVVWAVAESDAPPLSQAACAAIPGIIEDTALAGGVDKAIERFRQSIDVVLADKLPIPVADLGGALSFVLAVLQDPRPQEQFRAEWIQQLEEIKARLDAHGDFGIRLKRWAGKWTYEGRAGNQVKGSHIQSQSHIQLQQLAKEAVANPPLLTTALLTWLQSTEAKKSPLFFRYLGMEDTRGAFIPIIDPLGETDSGTQCFYHYYEGLSQKNQKFAGNHLRKLVGRDKLRDSALVMAILSLPPHPLGLTLIKKLHKENRTHSVLSGNPMVLVGWIDLVSPSEFHQLLTMVAGPEMEYASEALRLLVGRVGDLDESLKEFARDCLLAADLGYGGTTLAIRLQRHLLAWIMLSGSICLSGSSREDTRLTVGSLLKNTAGLHFGRLLWNWTRNWLCVCFAILRGKIRI